MSAHGIRRVVERYRPGEPPRVIPAASTRSATRRLAMFAMDTSAPPPKNTSVTTRRASDIGTVSATSTNTAAPMIRLPLRRFHP